MIENGFLRWGLTALLLAASLYAAFRAGRKSPAATRVGFGLHAAMLTAMVLMLAPGLRWPALPQILFFGLAAWWFVLRAVSRRHAPAGRPAPAARPAQGRRAGAGRGTLLYNALTMAAMAYMLAAMDGQRGHGALAGSEATGLPGEEAAHHGGPVGVPGQTGHDGVASAPGLPLPGTNQGWGGQAALVLAVAFALAAAVCAVQLLRRIRAHNGGGGADTILELVGAASMAVMFAALAA